MAGAFGIAEQIDQQGGRSSHAGLLPTHPGAAMIETIAVLLFIGLDVGFVAIALLWLSEKRAEADRNDARYRGRRRHIR